MDIIKPDSGFVTILGQKLSETGKKRLGYLPEERGLYRKLSVIDSIIYLASLMLMSSPRKRGSRVCAFYGFPLSRE